MLDISKIKAVRMIFVYYSVVSIKDFTMVITTNMTILIHFDIS